VSSSGTPRITRATGILILPPDGSSFLAMWCSMSLSSPSSAPLPPLLILIPPPCFPLTRWSSHLFHGLLQVLLHRAPCRVPVPAPEPVWARRPLALPRPLLLARILGPRFPFLPWPLRSPWIRRRRPLVLPDTSFAVRCTGTGVPAPPAAAATRGPFSTGDTDTTAAIPTGPCRTAGLPPAASSPTHAACSPDGDTARGWHTATPGSCGIDWRRAGFPSTLFRP
jgi:hypothetical protein